MRNFFLICIGFLLFPVGSLSQVTLSATCVGDSIHIQVDVFNNNLEVTPEEHGIVLFAEYVGTCENRITLTHPPMAMPPYLALATFSFRLPNIDPDRYFFYQAMGVDPDGELYPVFGGGDLNAWDYAGCDNAVLARGFLFRQFEGGYGIVPCQSACWSLTPPECLIDFSQAEPGWEIYVDTGNILNYYGRSYTIGMPGSPCAFISRVEKVENCDAVASEAMAWGTLKATYR